MGSNRTTVDDVERLLRREGYVLKKSKNHRVWKHPLTGRIAVTPRSSSDWRAGRNLYHDLKRRGIIAVADER